MQAAPTLQFEIRAPEPHRCPRCGRRDTIPMPAESLLDKLFGSVRYARFICRACSARFYRRPVIDPPGPAPAAEGQPVRNVAVCHKDTALTLQRVENIIRVAERRRRRRE